MLLGCFGLLIAAAGFMTDMPPLLRERLASTNEVAGTFVQTKRLATGESFVSSGTFRVRPRCDFTWRITEPFDALFWTDRTRYVYSNEDERVERPLDELPAFARFAALEEGDFSDVFKAFDALYKEDPPGIFHVLAKPREARLKKVLLRVEADGCWADWVLKATFPDGTVFSLAFQVPAPASSP